MRYFYSALFYCLIPLILLRLVWRSRKAPDYRDRWRERLGVYSQTFPQNVIWFHAVSVGETEAVLPLIRHLQQHQPDEKILITTTTPTGSARVRRELGDSVSHVYLPYDLPCVVRRFMRYFQPKLAVIVETEIWPNLFHYCGQHQIPLLMINARLSARSARRYAKLPHFMSATLASVSHIAAQSADDAQRFYAIGANPERVSHVGNIKFDLTLPENLLQQGQQLKTALFKERFVCLLASSHQGEEAIFLDVYAKLKAQIPELVLVIVPRHPERFSEVKKLVTVRGLSLVSRSDKAIDAATSDVYLVDTMGELKLFYACADVAFVGGSLVPVGGHNILEAAAVGVPILFGAYMHNFKDIAAGVLAQNAALQCATAQAVQEAILALYQRPAYRAELTENARAFISANRGAMARLYQLLQAHLS